MKKDVVGIVGGGIVGLAIGREITARWPGTRVVLFEKERSLAHHQTGHNSGVAHAGIYYKPGSLKASLCTRGRELLRDYCAQHELPYDECGKLVVAIDQAELHRLAQLERTATANHVPGLRRVTSAEMAEIEPRAIGLAALHSPKTAITDYVAIAQRLGDEIVQAGGEIRLSTRVTDIIQTPGRIEIVSTEDQVAVDRVIICGGLESDRLGKLAGGSRSPRIIPFKGEYMTVTPTKQHYVRGMIYPVPDPNYPFLGVHFTRRVDGRLEVGPNAFLAFSRKGYSRWATSPRDIASTLAWPGFWRFAGAHWRTGLDEIRGVLSTHSYMQDAQRYVPSIEAADVVRSVPGLRAQALDRSGSLLDDFVIEQVDRVTSIRNAPSPAATSSLAIAEHVVDQIEADRHSSPRRSG
jgi:(S)-2-hydroxyglutarate dehydrogenase